MTKNTKNIAASTHQRLLNIAKDSSRPFNELLQHFAIERFMYRLSKSSYSNRFILKGALMFSAWSGLGSRPTMDIDLLGKIENNLEVIIAALKNACDVEVEADGMHFDADTVTATRITEDAEHEGVRARIQGNLGNARISLQVDIGFGDSIVPGARKITYPVLLDFPSPELNGYTMESSIAEKFQAMVKRGVINSRMKDFYDIWILSRRFNFNGETLAKAVKTTFRNRKTPIVSDPVVFDQTFAYDGDKNIQWQGFIKKTKLTSAPKDFEAVVTAIKSFLEPITLSLAKDHPFRDTWNAPGPWRK